MGYNGSVKNIFLAQGKAVACGSPACDAHWVVLPTGMGRPKRYCGEVCRRVDGARLLALRRQNELDARLAVECPWCFSSFSGRLKGTQFCSGVCRKGYYKQMRRFGVPYESPLPVCACGKLASRDPYSLSSRNVGKHSVCLECRKQVLRLRDLGRGNSKTVLRRQRVREGEKISVKSLVARDGFACQICFLSMKWVGALSGDTRSIDHIVPISKGGQHTHDNVRLVHLRCNCKKGSKMISELGLCRAQ